MASLWRIAREWMQSQNPHRNIPPPKLSSVLEILQTQEEARDHVYYDALRRISASSKVSRIFCLVKFLFVCLKACKGNYGRCPALITLGARFLFSFLIPDSLRRSVRTVYFIQGISRRALWSRGEL